MCLIQISFFLIAPQIKIYFFFLQLSVLGREAFNVTNSAAIQNADAEFSIVK